MAQRRGGVPGPGPCASRACSADPPTRLFRHTAALCRANVRRAADGCRAPPGAKTAAAGLPRRLRRQADVQSEPADVACGRLLVFRPLGLATRLRARLCAWG